MNFQRVCLDPSFFWIGEAEDAPDVAEAFLRRVVALLSLRRTKAFDFFMHEDSGMELFKRGIVPSERHFGRILPHVDWRDAISAQDLSRVLNELLLDLISSDMEWPEVLLRLDKPVGAVSNSILNADKRRISEKSVMHYSFIWCFLTDDALYFFPRTLRDELDISSELTIEAADVPTIGPVDGVSFGARFKAYTTSSGLLKELDENLIWNEDANLRSLSLALQVMAAKRVGLKTDCVPFGFGPHFIATALRCGGLGGAIKSILMDAIFQILFTPEAVEASVFRKDKGKHSGARIREADNATAYRVHLTKSHEAYRLMFWKRDDGSIEFANVGPKFEEEIL